MVPRAARTADLPPGVSAVSLPADARAPALSLDLGEEVVVVLLAQIDPRSLLWGWWRIARGGRSLRGEPGLRFAKALGSGHEGGFGLRPSSSRQGLFAVFESEAAADRFLQQSVTLRQFRARSVELCTVKLRAWSCRGRWSGRTFQPSVSAPLASDGPVRVAALTRASIHPLRAFAFWRKAPPAEASLAQAPGCLLAAGLGEAPVLRQATFTIWDSVAAMDAYARSGAHLAAIQAAHREGYFSESMFVRFVPLAMQGQWKGVVYG